MGKSSRKSESNRSLEAAKLMLILHKLKGIFEWKNMMETTTWFRCACPEPKHWDVGQPRTDHSLQHSSRLAGAEYGAMDTAQDSTLYDHLIVWPPLQPALPVPALFSERTEYWWSIRNHSPHSNSFNQNINSKPAGIFLIRTTKRRCDKTVSWFTCGKVRKTFPWWNCGRVACDPERPKKVTQTPFTSHHTPPSCNISTSSTSFTALTVPCLPKA